MKVKRRIWLGAVSETPNPRNPFSSFAQDFGRPRRHRGTPQPLVKVAGEAHRSTNTKETSLLGSFFQILSSGPWDDAQCPVGAQLLKCVLLLLKGEGEFRIRPGCRCKSAVAANSRPESWTFQDWFPRPHVGQRGCPHRDAGLVTSDLRPQGPALSAGSSDTRHRAAGGRAEWASELKGYLV